MEAVGFATAGNSAAELPALEVTGGVAAGLQAEKPRNTNTARKDTPEFLNELKDD